MKTTRPTKEKPPVRKELENDVISHNKYLKCVVGRMSNICLLRCSHPLYRKEFAQRLKDERLITSIQLKQFTNPLNYD